MTESQTRATIRSAAHHGGSFMQKLAIAALAADPRNRSRILDAFPEMLAKYGPGSDLYSELV